MKRLLIVFLLGSCSVVENYQYDGQITYKGTTEYEFHLHEHFKTDGRVSSFNLQNIFSKGYNEYRIYLKIIDGGGGGYMSMQVYDNSNTLVDIWKRYKIVLLFWDHHSLTFII